jgi:hypothetical protein
MGLMHTRTLLSLTLLAAAGSVAAADGGSWDFYVRAQASAGLLGLSGDASYTDKGLGGTTFDMQDVGLDSSEVSPAFELGVGTPIFDFHGFLGWQSWSTDGDGTISKTINFGGESFTAGSKVSSKAELSDLYAEVNWSPIALNLAGFSIGLAAHQISVTSSLASGGQRAEFDESGIVPTLALRAYVAPLDMLEAEIVVHGLAVPFGDISGSYLFAQAQVAYYPMENIGVIGGWRHSMIDLEFDSGSTKAEASIALSGPYLGIAAQF